MRPQTGKPGPRRPVHKASLADVDDDSRAFESPDPDDGTDYGLEFTTSQLTLQDATNRRCSTLRKNTSNVRRARASSTSEEDFENRSPVRAPRTPQSNRQVQQKSIVRPEVNKGAKKRKAARPIQHARRMQREIKRLQEHSGLLIPRLPFSRLVREIIVQLVGSQAGIRVTEGALRVMQESSELYLTHRLQDSYLLTQHRGRVTLEVRDMALMAALCNQCR